MFVDPDGRSPFLAGGGGTAASGGGIDTSAGLAFDSNGNVGYFSSLGGAAGVNASADAFIGFFTGNVCDLQGDGYNISLTVGPISIAIFGSDNGHIGFTVGAGPSALPAGVSVAPRTQTNVKNLGNIVKAFIN